MTKEPDSEFLSEEEIERWANALADEFANPQSFWRALLLEGWEMTDLMKALSPLIQIPGAEGPFDPAKIPPMRDVILSNDRQRIFALAEDILRDIPRSSFDLARRLANPRKFSQVPAL
jgi:hypothetical protein